MVITRYLTSEIAKPLAAILGLLGVLFAFYGMAEELADSAAGLMPPLTLLALSALKLLIALDVLIPIALYLSVLLALARLAGASETIAMAALGISPAELARAVLGFALTVALGVGLLSAFVRPWAYRESHILSWQAAFSLDVDALRAGIFYTSADGAQVIFITHREGHGGPAQDVFVRRQLSDHAELVFAQLAAPLHDGNARTTDRVYLQNAHIYDLYPQSPLKNQIVASQGLELNVNEEAIGSPGYSPVVASLGRLLHSGDSADIAELQWRLSTPLSTILLALLAVPLSRARPRQNRLTRFLPAVLLYIGYYLFCSAARTWVQYGHLPAFPGLWVAPLTLALVTLGLSLWPSLPLSRRA
ncbi:LPS export ABC transporter permease LptF [Acidocella sp.]|uniref:LPS export ABC transporter permease LptF n=1 Tax=Acidocella sp. TaxID=50710 RepID=UPI00261D6365|nr:LPS export ABC transporter permease LptF [Acidocella sp.]